ncbi:MAG: alpha-amylase, partial [Betaproteobacteria bacterium]|nr:alpha-amylase [Betaproteobacteria bacterium]
MQWRWVTGWRRVLGAVALAGMAGCSVAPPVLPVPPGATDAVPAADTRSSLPPYWYTGAFIEVFVRSYQDSDGDGIGDLKGLTSRLDYLRDLGVRGIWLMPVTRSADHDHGYAVTDYRAIERDYGSLQDFDEFIRQAHARGIGVIMDYVLNHSAAQHPFFTQSRSSVSNPFHDWYVWQPTMPLGWDVWGKNPWTMTPVGAFYATFGPHMPDFNLRNPRVVAYHDDSLRFWLNRGLDGFRFDAVPHLIENGPQAWNDQPESHALMAQVRALVNRYDNRYIVCEATANPVSWSQPQSCGSAFAFEHERDVIRAAKGDLSALPVLAAFFRTRPLTMATMLTNHDSFVGDRLWNQFAGDLSAYRLAAATYLLQPGIPFIYYGEEIGMADGQLAGDARLRTPMSWAGDARTAGFTTGQPYRGLSANVATH